MLRFISSKHENDVLTQAKKLKGTNMFINEYLAEMNGDNARKARRLRGQKKKDWNMDKERKRMDSRSNWNCDKISR